MQRSKNRKCTQIGILNERSKSCRFDRSRYIAYALTNAEYEVTRVQVMLTSTKTESATRHSRDRVKLTIMSGSSGRASDSALEIYRAVRGKSREN